MVTILASSSNAEGGTTVGEDRTRRGNWGRDHSVLCPRAATSCIEPIAKWNVGPLIQKLSGIPRQRRQSIKPSTGPFWAGSPVGLCGSHAPDAGPATAFGGKPSIPGSPGHRGLYTPPWLFSKSHHQVLMRKTGGWSRRWRRLPEALREEQGSWETLQGQGLCSKHLVVTVCPGGSWVRPGPEGQARGATGAWGWTCQALHRVPVGVCQESWGLLKDRHMGPLRAGGSRETLQVSPGHTDCQAVAIHHWEGERAEWDHPPRCRGTGPAATDPHTLTCQPC